MPEVEARRELDRAEDADRILAEAHARLADGADDAALDVRHAAAPVEDLAAIEIVEERVDREVAAERVFVRLAEDVVAADEEVVVLVGRFGVSVGVAPERRDLDDLAAAEEHVREAEAAADDAAVAEERAHVVGTRARRDVEVLRAAAAGAGRARSRRRGRPGSRALEPAHDLRGVGVDRVLVERRVVALEAGTRMPLHRCRARRVRVAFRGSGLDGERRELGRRRKIVVGTAHSSCGCSRAYDGKDAKTRLKT